MAVARNPQMGRHEPLETFFGKTFWPRQRHVGILVPWRGTEPVPPVFKVWSFNHWTTRKALEGSLPYSSFNSTGTLWVGRVGDEEVSRWGEERSDTTWGNHPLVIIPGSIPQKVGETPLPALGSDSSSWPSRTQLKQNNCRILALCTGEPFGSWNLRESITKCSISHQWPAPPSQPTLCRLWLCWDGNKSNYNLLIVRTERNPLHSC